MQSVPLSILRKHPVLDCCDALQTSPYSLIQFLRARLFRFRSEWRWSTCDLLSSDIPMPLAVARKPPKHPTRGGEYPLGVGAERKGRRKACHRRSRGFLQRPDSYPPVLAFVGL